MCLNSSAIIFLPEKKAEEKVTGDSVLFSLKNEKEEKNVPTSELEFGKNK